MKKQVLTLLTVLVFVVLSAVSLAAQDASAQQAAPAESAKPEKMAKPAKHAMMAAAAETLSGKISMVDAGKKMVVVTGSDGVPYDFMVSKATKITVGGNKAMLDDLSAQTSKQASVTFMAMKRKGNLAKSIEVTP